MQKFSKEIIKTIPFRRLIVLENLVVIVEPSNKIIFLLFKFSTMCNHSGRGKGKIQFKGFVKMQWWEALIPEEVELRMSWH